MIRNRIRRRIYFVFILLFSFVLTGCEFDLPAFQVENVSSFELSEVPEYFGEDYVIINDNKTDFDEEHKRGPVFEVYGPLDKLGRCTYAFAKVGEETMPSQERGSIGGVKPSGWHTVKYDIVSGKYLYNRCHLIGYQLTGENANENNLITCTRQTNTGAMLEFENQVAKYIEETGNHVLYRSTPIFYEDDLVAKGIHLEAYSVEDNGDGIEFNVFLYNVQKGIIIDYSTGESALESDIK